MTAILLTIKKRPDFIRAYQKGSHVVKSGFILQVFRRSESGAVRIGFTATKKLGKAVERNRAKRRLRALSARILPERGEQGCDYVFVARKGVFDRPFGRLCRDLKDALKEIKENDSPRPELQPEQPEQQE